MSIEKTISDLTAAVVGLTAALNARAGASQIGAAQVQQPAQQQTPAAAMPAVPFAAPAAAPAAMFAPPVQQSAPATPNAPFTDGQGLIQYVMGAYKEMGPTKGALIQGVLTQLGYQNINDVKPEHYGSLFQGVEALKRG